MKKILLIILLVLSTTTYAQKKWEHLYSNDQSQWYYSKDVISFSKEIQVTCKYISSNPGWIDYDYEEITFLIDCKNKRYMIWEHLVIFEDGHWTGLGSDEEVFYEKIVPSSIVENLYNMFCNKNN